MAFVGKRIPITDTKVGGSLMGEGVDVHHVIVASLEDVED